MSELMQILHKYDVPGPRYTSYPTVPAWVEVANSQEHQKNLQSIAPQENLSLYFHIPFCEKLCHFCGCFKIITKDHSRSAPYVKTLLQEIKTVSSFLPESSRQVSQIHFGGGTPNFLQPEELHHIMSAVREHFVIQPEAEVAIEMHPRTSTPEFCEQLKIEGFNRISLGVQDFNDDVQKLINRHQTYDMTALMLQGLRDLGFQHFNFDLIYGLPGQNLKNFTDTLQKTLKLNPDRLAVYSYAHVPWKSPVQRSFSDLDLPSPALKLELFAKAYECFTANDYHLVGMDHFAKTSDELYRALQNGSIHRNFMGYSTQADAHQIGFGISSISYVNGHYFQNSKTMDDYTHRVEAAELPTHRQCLLTDEDHLRRDVINELMCTMRLDFLAFAQKHKKSFEEHFAHEIKFLDSFVQEGLVEQDSKGLRVVGLGRLVLRNIAMIFDEHLDDIRKNAKNPVFSRTV